MITNGYELVALAVLGFFLCGLWRVADEIRTAECVEHAEGELFYAEE